MPTHSTYISNNYYNYINQTFYYTDRTGCSLFCYLNTKKNKFYYEIHLHVYICDQLWENLNLHEAIRSLLSLFSYFIQEANKICWVAHSFDSIYVYSIMYIQCTCIYNVCTIHVQCMYNICTMYIQCKYNVYTIHVQCIYNTCTMYVQYIYNIYTM